MSWKEITFTNVSTIAFSYFKIFIWISWSGFKFPIASNTLFELLSRKGPQIGSVETVCAAILICRFSLKPYHLPPFLKFCVVFFCWSYWSFYSLNFAFHIPKVYLTILFCLLYFCKLVMASDRLTGFGLLWGRNYYYINNAMVFHQDASLLVMIFQFILGSSKDWNDY